MQRFCECLCPTNDATCPYYAHACCGLDNPFEDCDDCAGLFNDYEHYMEECSIFDEPRTVFED